MSLLLRDMDLCLGFDGQVVLEPVNQTYHRGERWILTGGNGAGKSTFLRAVLEKELILSGRREVFADPAEIAWIPQAPRFSRQMPCSVRDFLMGSLGLVIPAWKPLSLQAHHEIEAVLSRTGLLEFQNRPIASLSGGQVQRLLIARAFLLKAKIYLLDEPFSAVQPDAKLELISLLDEVRDRSLQIFALHEVSEMNAVGGKRLRMQDGFAHLLKDGNEERASDDVVALH